MKANEHPEHADQRGQKKACLAEDIRAIQDYVASIPIRDPRTPEELMGYDAFGLPA